MIDIKRYSFEDGPGIRSVVFFKGCPLRCIFCHNPEAQKPTAEIAFSRDRCIACGACVDECPQDALDLELPGRIRRDRCISCGKCAEVCPTDAIRLVGRYYSVESLTEVLLRDFEYYRHSGGGVTLTGGECTLFPEYVEALLKDLKTKNVHIVLETSGYFNYDTFRRKIYPHVDLIYYDFKLADEEAHKKYCGRPNKLILRNFLRLVEDGAAEIHPRIPLVPGITATDENLSSIAGFLLSCGQEQVRLLPYNPMGLAKYQTIGRLTPDLPQRFMRPEEEAQAYEAIKRRPLS